MKHSNALPCFSERSAVAVDAAGTGGAETGAAAVIAAVVTGTADAAGWGSTVELQNPRSTWNVCSISFSCMKNKVNVVMLDLLRHTLYYNIKSIFFGCHVDQWYPNRLLERSRSRRGRGGGSLQARRHPFMVIRWKFGGFLCLRRRQTSCRSADAFCAERALVKLLNLDSHRPFTPFESTKNKTQFEVDVKIEEVTQRCDKVEHWCLPP